MFGLTGPVVTNTSVFASVVLAHLLLENKIFVKRALHELIVVVPERTYLVWSYIVPTEYVICPYCIIFQILMISLFEILRNLTKKYG